MGNVLKLAVAPLARVPTIDQRPYVYCPASQPYHWHWERMPTPLQLPHYGRVVCGMCSAPTSGPGMVPLQSVCRSEVSATLLICSFEWSESFKTNTAEPFPLRNQTDRQGNLRCALVGGKGICKRRVRV